MLSLTLVIGLLTACSPSTIDGPDDCNPNERRNQHLEDEAFFATVTAVNADASETKAGLFVVDCNTEVFLNLVEPYDEVVCASDLATDRELAMAVERETLPVGQRVYIIRPSWSSGSIIHLIDDGADDVVPTSLNGTANELMVASGYWGPSATYSNAVELVRDGTAEYTTSDPSGADLNEQQAPYAPLILAAANNARINLVGGQGECIAAAQVAAEEAAAAAAAEQAVADETRRHAELWYANYLLERAEYLRTHPQEVVRCRDGDGDGRCNE
jgi:hypothetical protein